MDYYPQCHMNVFLRGLARSLDMLKGLYLHHDIACDHQTFLGGNLPWGLQTIKSCNTFITWTFKVTWETKTIISTTRVPVATKLERMVTYLEGLLTTESLFTLVTWSYKFAFLTKAIISRLQKRQTWANNNLPWWAPI